MTDIPPLAYSRPDSLAGALEALASPGARAYAGGTDLIVALKARAAWVASTRELVDIKGVPEAMGIVDLGDELRVGSLVTAEELGLDPLVSRFAKPLAEAASTTSAPALRARGTVGGNLITPHQVGDMATALLALNATAEVATSPVEVRAISVQTLLDDGFEGAPPRTLVLAVRFSKCEEGGFEKHGLRRSFSRSRVAVALAARGGRSRVALAGLTRRPFLGFETAAAIDRGDDVSAALRRDRSRFGVTDGSWPQSLVEALIERARARALSGG